MGASRTLRRAWYRLIAKFPEPVGESLRGATDTSLGYLGSISITRNEMIPPLRVRVRAGFGNWAKIGKELLDILVAQGGLKPEDRVLEVGCGFGRIAIALANYIGTEGRYEGIDVIPEAVDWCRTRITPRHPNFSFRLADVRNDVYNPDGAVPADVFTFPYASGSFDFVFLTPVFTHLLPSAVRNYLHEISRVLRPGGRTTITYFLLDEESLHLIESGRSTLRFRGDYGTYRVDDPARPARAVAYDLGFVREIYEQSDMKIVEPIHRGSWCGRDCFLSNQDIVIAEKNPPAGQFGSGARSF